MKHVVLNIFTITKFAKCKQFQLVIMAIFHFIRGDDALLIHSIYL